MAIERDIGCLLIDDPLYTVDALGPATEALARRGVRTERFQWDRAQSLHLALQRAYQRVRRDGAINGIVALGAGCDGAIALACQLPSDRLVLIEPLNWRGEGEIARQMRRIRGFARRNAAFCVADALILRGPNTPRELADQLGRALSGGHATLITPAEELWSNRKEVLNLGIFQFLRDGVLPKCLAENPEMCIIYG